MSERWEVRISFVISFSLRNSATNSLSSNYGNANVPALSRGNAPLHMYVMFVFFGLCLEASSTERV